ncbi:MAG: tetratricopeptide repeat protein [Bdellovibrionota bacterium]
MGALDQGPDFFDKLIKQAEGLADIKRYDDALAKVSEAIAIDPSNADAYGLQALIFIGLNRFEDCVTSADNLCRLRPESEWGYRLRSIGLRNLRRLDDSLVAANEAVRLGPDHDVTHTNLGNVLIELKRLPEADAAARKARELNPENDRALNILGRVALLQDKYSEAEEHFRQGLKIVPSSETYLFNLALALEKQGKKQESIEFYRLAAAANPQDPMAKENLKRLVQSYAGGIGLGTIGLIKVLSVLGRNKIAAGFVGTIALIVLVFVFYRIVTRYRRRKKIHPSVLMFVDEEAKVERHRDLKSFVYWMVVIAVIAVAVLIMSEVRHRF